MNVHFYLARPKRPKTVVICSITHRGKRIKLGTGVTVKTKNWNPNKQRVSQNSSEIHLNQKIEKIEKCLTEAYYKSVGLDDLVSIQYLTQHLADSGVLQRIPDEEKQGRTEAANSAANLTCLIDQFLVSAESRVRKDTLRQLKSVLHHFENYTKVYWGNNFDLSEVDESFYEDYVQYLFDEIQLTSNTVSTNLKRVKQFLKYCTKLGSCQLDGLDDYWKWSKFTREASGFALTEEEIGRMENLDLSHNKKLEKSRDLFLICVYTTLRYSDGNSLLPEMIQNNRLMLQTIKDNKRVSQGITPRLDKILSKYKKEGCPKLIYQKYNDNLKEIGRLAGLDESHVVIRYDRKSAIRSQGCPKWKLLSTHCARRTGITILLRNGVNPHIVMQISGHTSWKEFLKYVKFAGTDIDSALCATWGELVMTEI